MKYSILISLPEPSSDILSNIIHDLSNQYNSPIFEPHMTILGNIDLELNKIQKAVEEVAVHLNNLTLSLGPVSFSTTSFQSVFVRVNSTAQLMQLNLDIKKLLNVENNVFMPHISLMYGDHDMKTREKIATKIKLESLSFTANKIVIIPNKPNPRDWEPVAVISFGGRAKVSIL